MLIVNTCMASTMVMGVNHVNLSTNLKHPAANTNARVLCPCPSKAARVPGDFRRTLLTRAATGHVFRGLQHVMPDHHTRPSHRTRPTDWRNAVRTGPAFAQTNGAIGALLDASCRQDRHARRVHQYHDDAPKTLHAALTWQNNLAILLRLSGKGHNHGWAAEGRFTKGPRGIPIPNDVTCVTCVTCVAKTLTY